MNRDVWKSLTLGTSSKWFLMSVLVGIVSGCGAIAFQIAGQLVVRYVLVEYSGFTPGEGHGERALFAHPDSPFSFPMLLLVLTGGGLVSGLLVYTFAPEAE